METEKPKWKKTIVSPMVAIYNAWLDKHFPNAEKSAESRKHFASLGFEGWLKEFNAFKENYDRDQPLKGD